MPYVEVLMQDIHAHYPAVYENGAGLYIPQPYGFKWHPALTRATHMRLIRLQTVLHHALVAPALACFQPGKSASLSLFPGAGVPLRQIAAEAGRLARDFGGEFAVEEAANLRDHHPARR